MHERTEPTDPRADASRAGEAEEPTRVLRGHIGGLTEDRVVIVPQLHAPRAIEVRRSDVLDFRAGCPSGRCTFVVRASAPIREYLRYGSEAGGMAPGGVSPADQRSRRPASRTMSASSPRDPMPSFL